MSYTDCRNWEVSLNELVDGNLAGPERGKVEEHLLACVNCRRLADQLRALKTAAAGLPRSIQPERDLWPALAGVLRREKPGPGSDWQRRLLPPSWLTIPRLAAAALLLVGLTVGVTLRLRRPPIPGLGEGRQAEVKASFRNDRLAADYIDAESVFLRASDLLISVLDERKEGLTPETLAVVEENLRIINRAIDEVRSALESEPRDHQLEYVLTAMYRTKVDLLQRATRLPAAS